MTYLYLTFLFLFSSLFLKMISQAPKRENNLVGVKRIGDYSYLLNDEIGRGYSSTVYIGKDVRNNQPVAIKVVDMKKLDQDVHKELLASEIVCLRNLKYSKHILNLIDVINTVNNTYIITQLCQGKDLAKMIRAKKQLPEAEAINIMKQLISGYTEYYGSGVIHRDLKPANIFFKSGVVKIADFGFAIKQIDCYKWKQYNLGSPTYMPPQVLKQNKYSFKSDIWAFGIIMFEMIQGRPPWKTKSDATLLKKMIEQPIQSLLTLEVSPTVINFMKKCCCINHSQRMSPQQLREFQFNSSLNLFAQDKTSDIPIQNILAGGINIPTQVIPLQPSSQNSLTRPQSVLIPQPTSLKLLQQVYSPQNFRNTQKYFKPITQFDRLSPLKRQFRMNSDTDKKPQEQQNMINNQNQLNLIRTPSIRATLMNTETQNYSYLQKIEKSPQPFQITVIPTNKQEQQDLINFAEEAMVSQVHYCRFIFTILQDQEPKKEWSNNLKNFLKFELQNKIKMLARTVNEQKNYFKINGFEQLVQSNQFPKLRQIILKYYKKYIEMIGLECPQVSQQYLVVSIKECSREGINLALLQKILNLYQIKQLQKKIDYNQFAEKTKIHLLIGNKTVLDLDRLRNHISILGI